MKRIIFLGLVFSVGLTSVSLGQASGNKKINGHQAIKAKEKKETTATAETVGGATWLNTSTSQAYGRSRSRFSIADPTNNAVNQRTEGSMLVPSSRSLGVARGTYGFANGKLFLRSTTATSSGTNYGSGAVGTGTTITGIGTGENIPGVNGKSANAGLSLWGTQPPLRQNGLMDSARKQ